MAKTAKRGRPAGPGSVTIRVPLRLAPIFAAIVREYRAMARPAGYDGERTDASSEPDRLDDAAVARFMAAERADFEWDEDAGAWISRQGGVGIPLEVARREASDSLAASLMRGNVPGWLEGE